MKDIIKQLLELACDNVRLHKGGPFAAAIVRDGAALAFGTEQTKYLLDPTAHAEILAVRAACQAASSSKLPGTKLFTIFDPCAMCLASLDEVLIAKVYFVLPLRYAADRGWIDISLARPHNITPAVERAPIDDRDIRETAIRHLSGVPLGDYGPEIERRTV